MISPNSYYEDGIKIKDDEFGLFTDKTGKTSSVKQFTWSNFNRVSVTVITYGARITSIKTPDKNGVVDDIVMGFDNVEGYLNPLSTSFGATVGRDANGVTDRFQKVNWNHCLAPCSTELVLSYLFEDIVEDNPVLVTINFKLTTKNEFLIDFKAASVRPVIVNLANRSYFNLAGHDKGAEELYKHAITLNADYYTNNDDSGFMNHVCGYFDLRVPKVLGDVISKIPLYDGYGHTFCITKMCEKDTFVSKMAHPPSGRVLEVYSNQPGVQLYCANSLPVDPNSYSGDPSKLEILPGKEGGYYCKHGAFSLEMQNYIDVINDEHFAPDFPDIQYHHKLKYLFFVNE